MYTLNMAQNHEAKIVILHIIEPIPPVREHVKVYIHEAKWDEKAEYRQEMTIEGIKRRLQELSKKEKKICAPLELVLAILVGLGRQEGLKGPQKQMDSDEYRSCFAQSKFII